MKQVTVHNKSARLKHVNLGGGRVVSIAPTETPTAINFDSDEEAQRFTEAINAPAVKKWIDAGELELSGGGQPTNTASAAPSAFTAPPISKAEEPKEPEPEPHRTRRGRE